MIDDNNNSNSSPSPPAGNAFLDSVSSSKKEKKQEGSDFTALFRAPGALEDPELRDLLNKNDQSLNKRIKASNLEDSDASKKGEPTYNFKVEIFRIFSMSDQYRYQVLMNDIWNNTKNFASIREQKNWDKSGTLTIVIEYVEIIEPEPSELESALSDPSSPKKSKKSKKDKAHTKSQKVNLEDVMVDNVLPPSEDTEFVEYSQTMEEAMTIPSVLTQDQGSEDE